MHGVKIAHTCEFDILDVKQFLDIPEVAKKIRLENIFKRELRPLFQQILRDYRVNVAAFGSSLDASIYEPAFNGLLLKQYDRVQRAFVGEVAEQNGGKALFRILVKQDEEQLAALVGLSLAEWRRVTAGEKAALITATNQRQMDEALITAQIELQESGEQVTPAALAIAASAVVARQFSIRSNTIAQTETQESAEATKQIEASAIAGRPPLGQGPQFVVPPEEPVSVTKTWIDFGDSRVRPTHVAVSGTTLPEDGVFVVGDSRMNFPADTSLLASAAETINCRCSNRYDIQR